MRVRRVTRHIDGAGIGYVYVHAGRETDDEPYGYTIGHARRGRPELLVIGLPRETTVAALEAVSTLQAAARIDASSDATIRIRDGLQIKTVDVSNVPNVRRDWLWRALAAGSDFPVLQLVVSDENNAFPGDPRCHPVFDCQPILKRGDND